MKSEEPRRRAFLACNRVSTEEVIFAKVTLPRYLKSVVLNALVVITKHVLLKNHTGVRYFRTFQFN